MRGPLTNLVEPAAVHASHMAYNAGLPTAAQGLIGFLGGGASIGARALDATELPSLAALAGRAVGAVGGVSRSWSWTRSHWCAAPAQPAAAQPV